MVNQLKTSIQQNPSIYYPLVMSVGPHVRMGYFKQFIRRYITDNNLIILDAGFGRGEHLHWLEPVLPSATLVGYDLAETETYLSNFDIAQRRVIRADLQKVDLTKMTDDNRFDLIYTIDVLEHIPNNETVLRNFYNGLKSGGYLYLAMPYDDPNDDYILPNSWIQSFIDWTEEEHIGEMRDLKATQLLLENIGFEVFESHYTFARPTRLLWEIQQMTQKNPLYRFGVPILNALSSIEFMLPHPKTGNLRLIARKP